MIDSIEINEKREKIFDEVSRICNELKPEHAELILEFFATQVKALELFKKKQYDYGPSNISNFGDIGVLVRLNDKVERLKNLMFNNRSAENESIVDTWLDIGNYGLIGYMCYLGLWSDAKHYNISKQEETVKKGG
jgi:glutaredoxin 2